MRRCKGVSGLLAERRTMARLKRRLARGGIVMRGQEDGSFVDAGMAQDGAPEEKIGLQSDCRTRQ